MYLKETRRIDTDKVRAMCIRNDYYTRGTVEEYDRMFKMCKMNFGVLGIASDILEHSDCEKLMHLCCATRTEVLENICYEIINDCCYTCVSIEE